MSVETGEITLLLSQAKEGDQQALDRLIPIVYQELRRLAGHYMRHERPEHTLQATELVHEAYLRLVGRVMPDFRNRAHFFAVAAQAMRNLLVDHARARARLKRGIRSVFPLDDEVVTIAAGRSEEILAVEDALQGLAQLDPRQARIVELRYFGGLTNEEVAAVLDISLRTVKREWQMAKAWLRAEVTGK